jgi:hypothetical protein
MNRVHLVVQGKGGIGKTVALWVWHSTVNYPIKICIARIPIQRMRALLVLKHLTSKIF